MNIIRHWRNWMATRRHNRMLRAALLAFPGRQLMFCVVDGRVMVTVEGDLPTVPVVSSGVTLHWDDDGNITGGGGGTCKDGPSEGTNGGGHG